MSKLLQLFRFHCLKNYKFTVVKRFLNPKVYLFLSNNQQTVNVASFVDSTVMSMVTLQTTSSQK